MDVVFWGGPVYCNTLDNIRWERPTKIVCVQAEGSTNNATLYTSRGSLEALVDVSLGRVGLAGFSAFHGFARAVLASQDRDRVDYLHLADACFEGAGATQPFAEFLWFANEAVAGRRRMTITTNGPWGQDIHYSYGGTNYDLTSGAKCVQLFWDLVVPQGEALPASVPDGLPQPTKAQRYGELYWFHYEKGGHAWHANELAAPIIQAYGAPWLARGTEGDMGATFKADCSDAIVWFDDQRFAHYGPGEKTIEIQDELWPTAVDNWRSLIYESAARHGVAPVWVAAVMAAESRGITKAGSGAGARGLMQLMPVTFNWGMGREGNTPVLDEEIYDPATNIDIGTKLLAYLDHRYDGNIPQIIASYNAGSARCADASRCPNDRWRMVVDCGYVDKVLGWYNKALRQGYSVYASGDEQKGGAGGSGGAVPSVGGGNPFWWALGLGAIGAWFGSKFLRRRKP